MEKKDYKNVYKVYTSSNYYYVSEENCLDWIGDKVEVIENGKNYGEFNTYEEAKKVFDSIDLDYPDKNHKEWGEHSKFIHDEITGELACSTFTEREKIVYDFEDCEDVSFTMKQLGNNFK